MKLMQFAGNLALTSANPDDCAGLMQHFNSLQELTDWGGEGFRFPPRRLDFLQQLYKKDSQSFILSQPQGPVAFGQICQRFDRHHLARLLVLPQWRGQGLSQLLLLTLLARGQQQDNKKDFSLFVFKHNLRALHCYQSFGFTPAPQPGTPHPGLVFMQYSQLQANRLLQQMQPKLRLTATTVHCTT